MADESLLEKVHDLSDLELAVLLCFISREHCLISTPSDTLNDVVEELQLVANNTFGLQPVVVECTQSTTLEDFASSLLLPSTPKLQTPTAPIQSRGGHNSSERPGSYFTAAPGSFSARLQRPPRPGAPTSPFSAAPHIAPVIIAKNLDCAPQAVQIQALELLRTRRIFTRTSVQTAPKHFIFIPVVKAARPGEGKVTQHLNDFFFVAHWHDPEHDLINLEERDERALEGGDEGHPQGLVKGARISESEISHLTKLSQQVQVATDVTRYQMNIISHLRMHRAVAEGISPAATKHFDHLIRCLAPLHNLDYVTPALVGLAARKVYPHRIYITPPEKERSMQWGSKLGAMREVLDGVGPEDVIDDVLGMVSAPL